ncbi:MAG: DoxX family protein [Vicinamibacterales bacterium]
MNAYLHDSASIPSLDALARAARDPEETPLWEHVLLWIAQIAVAGLLLASAAAKIAGTPSMIALFSDIGYGQGLRAVAGAVELGAGLALLLPATAIIGAILAVPAFVAMAVTQFATGSAPAAALVGLVLALGVAWIRRPE